MRGKDQIDVNVEKLLQKRKLKPTAMRIVVLDFLFKHKRTVSLRDVESSLELTDRATLFRTLKSFEDHKIVHTIEDGTGHLKYALCEEDCDCNYPEDDVHVHFHCVVCSETQCLPKFKVPIRLPDEFSPQQASVVVRGICNKCQGSKPIQ